MEYKKVSYLKYIYIFNINFRSINCLIPSCKRSVLLYLYNKYVV